MIPPLEGMWETTNTQILKYTNTQILKYTNTQKHTQTQIHQKLIFLETDNTTFRRDVGNHSLSMLGAERYQNQLCSTANAEMFK